MEIFDTAHWREQIVDVTREILSSIARALPIGIAVVFGLVAAWLMARGAGWLCARLLRQIGVDRVAEKLSVTSMLRRAGATHEPSALAGRVVFWALFLAAVASIIGRLGLQSVGTVFNRVVAYVPNLVAAGIIVIAGLVFARLVRNLVSANLGASSRIGRALQGTIVVVAVVIALEQLGVNTDLMVVVITVVVGATALTMGVAFALGARPVVTHILAGHFLRASLRPGMVVDVAGRRGQVERVGPVDTVFRQGDRAWSMPNARLLDEVMER